MAQAEPLRPWEVEREDGSSGPRLRDGRPTLSGWQGPHVPEESADSHVSHSSSYFTDTLPQIPDPPPLRAGSWAPSSFKVRPFSFIRRWRKAGRRICCWRLPVLDSSLLTFYRLHFLYIVCNVSVGSIILWLSPKRRPDFKISFADALFNAASAGCVVGLNSIDMQEFSDFDQVVLMCLIIVGGHVFTSLLPVLVRRHYFNLYIQRHTKKGGAETKQLKEVGLTALKSIDEERQSSTAFGSGIMIPQSSSESQAGGSSDRTANDIRNGSSRSSSLNGSISALSRSQIDLHIQSRDSPRELEQPINTSGRDTARFPRFRTWAGESARNEGKQSTTNTAFGFEIMIPQSSESQAGGGSSISTANEIRNGSFLSNSLHGPDSPLSRSQMDLYRQTLDSPREREREQQSSTNGRDASTFHSHTWSGESARKLGQMLKEVQEHLVKKEREMGGVVVEGEKEGSVHGGEKQVNPSELRTVEYKALQVLSWLVPAYLFTVQMIGFIAIFINFAAAPSQQRILEKSGVSRAFFAAFQTVSGFQNAGLVLLSASLFDFQRATFLLLVVGALILLGNTMYAPTLRGVLRALHALAPPAHKETIKYLLDHPRRCYTHLFPRDVTAWLILTVVAFNLSELIAFCSLDWNVPALEPLSGGYKIQVGLFQSLNTRSSGFLVLTLGELSPAMLVLYIVMMYVAVYPVFLSRQTSRESTEVYDDLDLGIFRDLEDKRDQSLLSQGRMLLARDSAFIFLAIFIICIIQSHEIETDRNFTIFNIFFEVISAYGNVGLSIGYTCVPSSPSETCVSPTYSFVGAWKPGAKMIVALLMLLGRHRGLPDNIDPAVTLPESATFREGPRRQLQDVDPEELAQRLVQRHNPKKSPGTGLLSPSVMFRALSRNGRESEDAPILTKSASLPNDMRGMDEGSL